MNRTTIFVVLGCVLALIGWQMLVNKIYPPVKKKPVTVAAPATNEVSAVATAVVEQVVEKIEPAPEPEAAAPRTAEQIAVLSNAAMRVEFTSWGGGVRTVELLQHKSNGAGNIVLNGTNAVPALSLSGLPGSDSGAVFAIEQPDAQTLVMRAANGVTKTFSLSNDHLITGRIELPAAVARSVTNLLVTVGTASLSQPKEPPTYLVVDWQGASKFRNRTHGRVADRVKAGQTHEPLQAGWVAVKNQYFAMVATPATNVVGVTYTTNAFPHTTSLTAWAEIPVTREADGRASCTVTEYAGPKDYGRLAALGRDQDEVMDFGTPLDGYSGLFGALLYHSLAFFHRLVPNYGVAIVLATIAIKILFWPIQAQSIRSMKAMQKFQPLMTKLREKYKDDPQRLNAEMMKLYKEHKINPFSGCLPMLIQLPVLIAFYRVLISDIALRGAAFLWIKDLSQADTIFTIAGLIPVNPLPLIMVATQIWQQRITPTTGDPQQAKMMQFMPLMMLLFFYKVAAGLTLYWTVQQVLSLAQQWWSMRQDTPATPPTGPLPAGKTA